MPPSEEDSDEEEQMAELRRLVLAARPFKSMGDDDEDQKKTPVKITREPERPPETIKNQVGEEDPGEAEASDDSDGDDGLDEDFDNLIKAVPVGDKSGIAAMERKRALDRRAPGGTGRR